ncbi:hypothetical protein L207DRAFT_431552 [Hyaloscypha variabilis F]|uniref:Uncharacterized protein n=1 Tax=Hyaloscypha variabilis (strain UAMH 11265 / GT02V1 / F) TaxID=1149755 RepID=A0A2J6RHG8_HYAVF|nr:hypothetical protein L207DRAFT_431552 [Hyaloscypha variabilis F]
MNQRGEAAGRRSGRKLNILDPRKASHERRKRELLEILEPVLGSDDSDSSSIFLCWGKDNRCHIAPVKIPNSADDVTIWQEIRRLWYAHRGDWRKRLNLFGVREVRIVEISIAGRELKGKQRTNHKRFVGTYTTEDLAAEKGRLEQTIASYDPQEFPCPYNPSTGRVNCFSSCISYQLDGITCPEQTLYQARRELSRLNMRPFLTLAFSDPGVATVNGLLEGEGVINTHSGILSKLESWHCPKLGELQFRALIIDEDRTRGSQCVVLLLTVVVIFLMVAGAKLAYGDWGTAWNVGCFLVALATLLWMWANHTVA